MKNKFTGTKKYNWHELKAKFMVSNYQEARVFIKAELGTFNGAISRKTVGWTHEKEMKDREAYERVASKIMYAQAENLLNAYKNLIEGVKFHVSSLEEIKKLSIPDILIIWKILRTENNLPIQIIKNLNTEIPLPDKPPPLSEEKNNELNEAMNILKLNPANGMEGNNI